MSNKTQAECKNDFADLCKEMKERIDIIDKNTPCEPIGSLIEPSWWADMMEIKRAIFYWEQNHIG